MKLFFRSYGEGPPLVILHGLFGMSDNWQSVGKKLAENYSVIIPDLRNHGQSPHSDIWDLKSMSEDVQELIQSLGLVSTVLIGHSLGGKVAMTLALKNPELISKLIVVDIATKKYPVSPFHQHILQVLSRMELTSRKEVELNLIKENFDSATIGLLLKNLVWQNDTLAWRFNRQVIEQNLSVASDAIAQTQMAFPNPALFLNGERSSYMLESDKASICLLFPEARFETIAGAGHWVHADKPLEFVQAVESFLQ